jgi:ABC-2 type transport system ATP-binding protein
VILTTAGLGKTYGRHTALSDVDLAVTAGSVYGLVGPNGAGKTTLLTILAGLRRPTAGTVHIGVPRNRVAVLPDTPQFDPWLTGREVTALAAQLAGAGSGAARVAEVLRDAGLADAADRRVGGYSRGMLQRLGIAATLVGEPEVLLLDEPASALDPAGRREVLDLIAHLRGRATVVLSSHILADVQEVCDTLGILRAGRLLYQGPVESLLVGRAVPAYRVHLRSPVAPAAAALRDQSWVTGVAENAESWLRVTVRSLAEAERHLPAALAGCAARVISVSPEAADLEDVFLELTS